MLGESRRTLLVALVGALGLGVLVARLAMRTTSREVAKVEAGAPQDPDLAAAESLASAAILSHEADDSPATAARIDAFLRARREQREFPTEDHRSLAERSLAVRATMGGSDTAECVTSLLNLAWCEARRGDAKRAIELGERALEIQSQDPKPSSPEIPFTHEILGWAANQKGDLRRARREYETSLHQREQLFGLRHLEVAASLNLLGGIQKDQRENALAKRSFESALSIRRELLPANHRDVGSSLSNLGTLHHSTGHYARARSLYEEALPIREAAGDSLGTAETSHNLGILWSVLGDYTLARRFGMRALQIREQAYGLDHNSVASTVRSLARLEKLEGNYSAAISLYERALGIWTRTGDARQPRAAGGMIDLARLLAEMRQDDRALAYFDRAITVTRTSLGADHPQVANALGWLATFWVERDSLARAAPLFREARDILAKAESATPLEAAWAELDLAAVLGKLGERARARRMFIAAMPRIEEVLGPNHVEVARSLGIQAEFLLECDRLSEALPALERALRITENAIGMDEPSIGDLAARLAKIHARAGRPAAAFESALRAERIWREHLRLTSRSLSERYALGYAGTRSDGRDLVLQLAARNPTSIAAAGTRSLDVLVRWRGLVLDEMAARSRAIETSGDSATARLVAELNTARQRLANLTVRGPENLSATEYRALLDAAREERERGEQQLARRSAQFRRELELGRIGLKEVAAALPPGSALMSWARTDVPEVCTSAKDLGATYVGFVLRAGSDQPHLVPLGGAAIIDSCVMRWRSLVVVENSLLASKESACRAAGDALRRKVWDPLAMHLAGLERVFLVADGALQLVSFAALPAADGRYLVETAPLLHALSAERDLVAAPMRTELGEGLLAIGGPDFDAGNSLAATAPEDRAVNTQIAASEGGRTRAAAPDVVNARSKFPCADLATTRFPPLPAAGVEISSVAKIYRKTGRSAKPLIEKTGRGATEAAFKRFAPGRRIVHVASHGFFLGSDCVVTEENKRGMSLAATSSRTSMPSENPLLRAGLVFAGANMRGSAPAGAEDGILTAEEISGLDLHLVEWAVLSACDTGIGDILQCEGIFGLRRSLELAGVHTSIMSLWPVADDSTEEWMRHLYTSRWVRGMDTPHSIRSAMLAMLQQTRSVHGHTHPAGWAGFVAAGDWR